MIYDALTLLPHFGISSAVQTGITGYREILVSEYSQRRERNQGYSLRAFARDLGITYSRLHEAMNGKRGISPKVGRELAASLGLGEREREFFIADVEALHSRNTLVRRNAVAKLQSLARDEERHALELDVFAAISHWYHLALLELTRLKGFCAEPEWIAARLGIQPMEAQAALERLLRLGLLEKTRKGLVAARAFVFTPSDIPSAALKRNHEQILDRAKQALHFQPVEARDLTSVVMGVDSREMPRAKKLLKEFRRSFSDQLEAAPEKDAVYCLSLQFFRLDQSMEKKK